MKKKNNNIIMCIFSTPLVEMLNFSLMEIGGGVRGMLLSASWGCPDFFTLSDEGVKTFFTLDLMWDSVFFLRCSQKIMHLPLLPYFSETLMEWITKF